MSDSQWYVAVQGQQQGPMSAAEVVAGVQAGRFDRGAHVFTQGMAAWEPITSRAEFSSAFSAAPPPAPGLSPPPVPAAGHLASGRQAHEIDFEILGSEMQMVEITLDPQEACVAEAGAFMYMDPSVQMETVFGDGSDKDSEGGFMGKLLGAGKRLITGESLFMTVFANQGGQRQVVAFGAPYPGKIIDLDLAKHGGAIICQKDAFLCAAKGVSVGIAFQRKIMTGLFGGEGFIMQKLEGDGLAFVHAGGTIVRRDLAPGETLRVDTGCLVALEQQVSYDVQPVRGVKSMIFGGEGLFFATLTGPGKIWLQSLPFSRLAGRIYRAAPQTGGSRKGEGSILDAVGGLGNLLDGD